MDQNKVVRKQKVCISIPVCDNCSNDLHPFTSGKSHASQYIAIISAIAPLCILFGIIRKDTFLINPLAGVITLLISAFISYGAIFLLYEVALHIYEAAYPASLNAKPYCDLPVVKLLIAEGFEDGDGSSKPIGNISNVDNMSLSMLESELKDKYSCFLNREKK